MQVAEDAQRERDAALATAVSASEMAKGERNRAAELDTKAARAAADAAEAQEKLSSVEAVLQKTQKSLNDMMTQKVGQSSAQALAECNSLTHGLRTTWK